VALIGAGPGDPELLTLKALRMLQDADVIVHDRLVPAALLDFARRDAERIGVGEPLGGAGPAWGTRASQGPNGAQGADASSGAGPRAGADTSRDDVNRLLIEQARLGRRVVRLKSGPVFGNDVRELDALARAGIAFSVIPGVSAGEAAGTGVSASA
jgi:uroporphyrin-III C-methyltransferase / precorrin-2 dehydrogenase / sirohydrochlorin ferrochelatase